MEETYLLLGGNIGKVWLNFQKAKELINKNIGEILAYSSCYYTAAWGVSNQPDYLNQALKVSTNLYPIKLLSVIQQIEKQLGRIREKKWQPRTIDIDILFYGNKIINIPLPHLIIPHKQIEKRGFTLALLSEIDSNFKHPVLKKSVKELLEIYKSKFSKKLFLMKKKK